MAIDLSQWTCPLPLRDYPSVVLGHGGGGKLSAELIEHLFLPAFRNDALANLADGAVVTLPGSSTRLALTTDSFVVRPLFFPGSSIGDLAINGTVNDLAMCGAHPLCLTAGFIIEEGLPMATLAQVVARMAEAAARVGVPVVTGDTKVVEKGHGDGLFINTTGLGLVPPAVEVNPSRARPGDVVIVSGTVGDHGIAVLSVREGLTFETTIESDCAPLHELTAALFAVRPDGVHVLRDPTRGGLAGALNEIAARAEVGIVLDERTVPVRQEVQAACELLGLDPLYIANEGKLIAIVAREDAEAMLQALRAHPLGAQAAIIGEVTDQHAGMVIGRTAIGATRVIPAPLGEQLPRIC
ncbi:MAG: hydrogenase expression/formation protein HypE [Thermoflexales bacterium]